MREVIQWVSQTRHSTLHILPTSTWLTIFTDKLTKSSNGSSCSWELKFKAFSVSISIKNFKTFHYRLHPLQLFLLHTLLQPYWSPCFRTTFRIFLSGPLLLPLFVLGMLSITHSLLPDLPFYHTQLCSLTCFRTLLTTSLLEDVLSTLQKTGNLTPFPTMVLCFSYFPAMLFSK